MTFGMCRPVIVLPTAAERWRHDHLKRALAHELAHIDRADWFVQCCARVISAAYWFHPMIWALYRRLRLDAEHACDDVVIQRADAVAYAHQLITVAEQLTAAIPATSVSMAGQHDLVVRVSAVLDSSRPHGRAGHIATTTVIGAALLLLFSLGPFSVAGVAQTSSTKIETAPLTRQWPSFDVASIKSNASGDLRGSMRMLPGGHIEARNRTARLLVQNAYHLQDFQVVGGPAWFQEARFDISAKSAGDVPRIELELMMRRLLTERFKLSAHVETRTLPTYVLRLARPDGRLGPAIHAATNECVAAKRGAAPPPPPGANSANEPSFCGFRVYEGKMLAGGVDVPSLAEELTGYAHRPIIDETGLNGVFDFTLDWTPDGGGNTPGPAPQSADNNTTLPSFFTALREQLGLKLEPAKGPIEVLVIDRIEKPTED
jgi:uncharacterized protein (TIGR03435 family)